MTNRALKLALWSIPTIALLYPMVGYAGEMVATAFQNAVDGASYFFVDFDQLVTSGAAPAKI